MFRASLTRRLIAASRGKKGSRFWGFSSRAVAPTREFTEIGLELTMSAIALVVQNRYGSPSVMVAVTAGFSLRIEPFGIFPYHPSPRRFLFFRPP